MSENAVKKTAFRQMQRLRGQQQRQKGAVLLVGLIFLLVLTIIGVSAIQMTALDEKMVSSLRDKNLSFQMAETGLVAGEAWVQDRFEQPDLGPPIDPTYDALVTPVLLGRLETGGASPDRLHQGTVAGMSGNGVDAPRYIIEDFGRVRDSLLVGDQSDDTGVSFYRVTARGQGRGVDRDGDARAESFAQSTYSLRFN